jgi:hypothetical protein
MSKARRGGPPVVPRRLFQVCQISGIDASKVNILNTAPNLQGIADPGQVAGSLVFNVKLHKSPAAAAGSRQGPLVQFWDYG